MQNNHANQRLIDIETQDENEFSDNNIFETVSRAEAILQEIRASRPRDYNRDPRLETNQQNPNIYNRLAQEARSATRQYEINNNILAENLAQFPKRTSLNISSITKTNPQTPPYQTPSTK